ncbi:MAG: M20/M25/M40 family metallo-hydrolase [Rhodobacteraceae bacterium]|nr:M20/M25/M40 family metallo-hydrolase [Paracoccaceae bacterium]
MTDAAHPPQPAPGWPDPAQVLKLAELLVRWPSVGGTAGEAEFAPRLHAHLAQWPCFRANPDDLVLLDSHGSPMTRNLVAIIRGTGSRALALAGHYDTVAIDNYHDLAPLACQPDKLLKALLDDLSSRPLTAQEARARDDLASGDFVPGRGMLDMKSGLAAGLAVLERFASLPDRQGNLVMLITPDEERESRGMRALRRDLPALMNARGLRIEGAINMDVTSDQGDGQAGRAVYHGSIGKLLPFALVIGQSAHAAYPFEGSSAALIGAEIVRAIEGNAALADTDGGDIAPPPICLEARDLRGGYEVTTPERVWLSFNWLYQSGSAAERFAQFHDLVAGAAEQAQRAFAAKAADFAALSGTTGTRAEAAAAPILTLAELRARACPDARARAAFAEFEQGLAQIDNPLELSRRLVEWLVDAAQLTGPAVVVGFAGLHYPPARLDPARRRDGALLRAIARAQAALNDDPQARLLHRPHFQGISDISFLGQPAQAGAEVVAANTPAARLVDRPEPDALDFPVVNIGPWGREFHQKLERVYAPYAFQTLPRILALVAAHFLGQDDTAPR